MELIFFQAARVMLCFEFLAKPVLVTHQCFGYSWTVLHSIRFSVARSACLGSRVGAVKSWGGDIAETADPNWPKRYSAPYQIILSSKNCGVVSKAAVAQRLALHWCAVGGSQWLPLHHLVFVVVFLLSLHLLNCLCLGLQVFLTFALLVLFLSL